MADTTHPKHDALQLSPSAQSNDEKQVVVTLALIRQVLEQCLNTVNHHEHTLFGNGDPEHSITWEIKQLAGTLSRLESKMEEHLVAVRKLQSDMSVLKQDDAFLPWRLWCKKLVMKWLPLILIALAVAFYYRDPILEVVEQCRKP